MSDKSWASVAEKYVNNRKSHPIKSSFVSKLWTTAMVSIYHPVSIVVPHPKLPNQSYYSFEKVTILKLSLILFGVLKKSMQKRNIWIVSSYAWLVGCTEYQKIFKFWCSQAFLGQKICPEKKLENGFFPQSRPPKLAIFGGSAFFTFGQKPL